VRGTDRAAGQQSPVDRRGVALIGNSVDSIYSHIAWTRDIEKKFGVAIKFPVIADLDQRVARTYGMIHEPSSMTASTASRATGRT